MKKKTNFDEDSDWRLKEVHHDINKVGKNIQHVNRQIEIVEGYCVKMSAAIELLTERIKMIEEKQGGIPMPQGFNQEEYDADNVPDWYGAGDDNLWKKKDGNDGR